MDMKNALIPPANILNYDASALISAIEIKYGVKLSTWSTGRFKKSPITGKSRLTCIYFVYFESAAGREPQSEALAMPTELRSLVGKGASVWVALRSLICALVRTPTIQADRFKIGS